MRPTGEDVREGALVLNKGKTIRPYEISVLAAVGKAHVSVHRRPRVCILATGDELVDVGEKPRPRPDTQLEQLCGGSTGHRVGRRGT